MALKPVESDRPIYGSERSQGVFEESRPSGESRRKNDPRLMTWCPDAPLGRPLPEPEQEKGDLVGGDLPIGPSVPPCPHVASSVLLEREKATERVTVRRVDAAPMRLDGFFIITRSGYSYTPLSALRRSSNER